MAGSQKPSDFTINAAAATGKFRVQPHIGQCQSVVGVISQFNSHRDSDYRTVSAINGRVKLQSFKHITNRVDIQSSGCPR